MAHKTIVDFENHASKEKFMDALELAIKNLTKSIAAYERQSDPALYTQITDEVKQIREGIEKLRNSGISDYTLINLEAALQNQTKRLQPPLDLPETTKALGVNRENRRAIERELTHLFTEKRFRNIELKDSDKELIKDYVLKFVEEPQQLHHLVRISESSIKKFHLAAAKSFHSGNYKQAMTAYLQLISLDIGNPQYWKGLASCLLGLKRPKEAAPFYLMSIGLSKSLGLEDPEPFYNLAACQIANGIPMAAKESFKQAIAKGLGKPEFANLVASSQQEIEKIDLALKSPEKSSTSTKESKKTSEKDDF